RLFQIAAQFTTDWPRSQRTLISWVIFNYLIGNRDTHAKNLSFTLSPGSIRLTPFYDLLSTAIYPAGEKELSLKIGGQNRAHAVNRDNWRRFARDIKAEWPLVESTARRMAASLPARAEAVAARMTLSTSEKRRLKTVMRLIAAQCRHLQHTLVESRAQPPVSPE
ncbi:MAG TPA: HipA domain-containing protein, partial [Burkholderiales bacterium]|nr:HipA domain-containing protein [Burkholderiales bacterium]